jgi:hypothetical protein
VRVGAGVHDRAVALTAQLLNRGDKLAFPVMLGARNGHAQLFGNATQPIFDFGQSRRSVEVRLS